MKVLRAFMVIFHLITSNEELSFDKNFLRDNKTYGNNLYKDYLTPFLLFGSATFLDQEIHLRMKGETFTYKNETQ